MYAILFSDSAIEDLRSLRKSARQMVVSLAESQLAHEPLTETRNRKPLRPNDLARWELRAGRYRIFYDVDEDELILTIKAVGIKEHNKLLIRGEEYSL